MAEAKFKIPKQLGLCADLLYETKARRLAAQKVVDELAKQESLLKDHLINTLPKGEASGVAGKLARVSIGTKEVFQVKDWDAFWKAFKKGRDEDLLQRRLSDSAVAERFDAGKQVAGVEPFKVVTVSLNKL